MYVLPDGDVGLPKAYSLPISCVQGCRNVSKNKMMVFVPFKKDSLSERKYRKLLLIQQIVHLKISQRERFTKALRSRSFRMHSIIH